MTIQSIIMLRIEQKKIEPEKKEAKLKNKV